MPYTRQETTEIFHLLFLRQLETKLDKSFYVLKGGCNLRFFFKSMRYSEDIDLDVKTVAPEMLTAKINKVLTHPSFAQILRTRGIVMENVSAPKQTETTQRWKIGLSVSGGAVKIPTKIEFSRRGRKGKPVLEKVDPILLQHYELHPVLCSHYDRASAIEQKMEAILKRAEMQARDIFDLHFLLETEPATIQAGPEIKNRILQMDYAAYKSQVIAYLHPDHQSFHDSPSRWNELKQNLIKKLGGL